MAKSNKRSKKIHPRTFQKSKSAVVYLDYASSAIPASANPGAIHALGVEEKNKLEKAREITADVLNVRANEIIFTSGATESNNLAILGLVYPYSQPSCFPPYQGESIVPPLIRGGQEGLPHIVTTNIEHASVLEVCRHLEKTGQAEVTFVPVETNGIVDPRKIKNALKNNTVLVSVMYANNEIGTVQPIREIAKEVRHWKKTHLTRLRHPLLAKERIEGRNIFPLFHTDAVQAVNYLPINAAELNIDLMSINSAKIYGPKGIGALYVKKGTPLSPIMFGGNQEFGLRPGTENAILAIQFAQALRLAAKIRDREANRLSKLRDYFFEQLEKISRVALDIPITVNGDLQNRLPNNVNITIPNIPSDLLVIELSARGIMTSAKSACKAGDGKASHVIEALRAFDGLPAEALAQAGSLRFSLGKETTKKDIDDTIKALSEILTKLKIWYN